MQASESYELIQEIDDKEAYFEQLKTQLEAEYECLVQELEQLKPKADEGVFYEPCRVRCAYHIHDTGLSITL